ncbi:MAG: hypothetical protein ACOX4D_06535 [Bacteroidales bacterium]|jgi:hypothetical protein
MNKVKIFKSEEIYIDDVLVESVPETLFQENTYDDSGNVISEKTYNLETGEIEMGRDLTYNSNNKIIKEVSYGSLEASQESEFVYDSNLLLEEKHFFDGYFQEHLVHHYDEFGNKVKSDSLDEFGELDEQKIYHYNNDNTLKSIENVYDDGERNLEIKHEYDENQNVTKTIYYTLEEKEIVTNMEYYNSRLVYREVINEFNSIQETDTNTFDNLNRLIKAVHTEPDVHLTTIYEYLNDTNMIANHKIYDGNGLLIVDSTRKYNENNSLCEQYTTRYNYALNRKIIEVLKINYE